MLYKRGSTYWMDITVRGVRYRESTGETKPDRAKTAEQLRTSELLGFNDPLPKKAPLLRDFSTRFIEAVDAGRLEPSSRRYYKQGWKLLKETTLSAMTLDTITTDAVTATKFTGSPSRANQALRTLHRMLKRAEEWKLIRQCPRIPLVKEYGRELLIDADTEAKLLAVAQQPLKDILIIIQDTGMRPSEVFRMKVEHINWTERTYFNAYGKTRNATRHVPLSDRVFDLLFVRCGTRKKDGYSPAMRSAAI